MGISIPSDSRLGRSVLLFAVRFLRPGCLCGTRLLPACAEPSECALLACTACPEPSRRERSERAPSPSTSLGSGVGTPVEFTGLLKPEVNSAEWSHACPFPHESLIALALSAANVTHSPLLFANRGYTELAMVPSLCKQRATLLSNRGKIRVVQPLRHRLSLQPNRHTNLQSRLANSLKIQGGVCF